MFIAVKDIQLVGSRGLRVGMTEEGNTDVEVIQLTGRNNFIVCTISSWMCHKLKIILNTGILNLRRTVDMNEFGIDASCD